MKKYGITLFLTLILLLGLVVPAVSAQVPEAALAAAQEVPALGFPDIWRMMLERVCMAG